MSNDRLTTLLDEYADLEKRMEDPSIHADQALVRRVGRRFAELAPLYAAHGVREYWVVDAVRQTLRVHRAPEAGVYADVEEYEAHDSIAALLLPELCIRLDALD